MPRRPDPLTVQGIKAKKTPGLYADGNGLYLSVRKATSSDGVTRSWLFIWVDKTTKKRNEMGLGSYDTDGQGGLSLKQARDAAVEAQDLLKRGINPIQHRKEQRELERQSHVEAELEAKGVVPDDRDRSFALAAEAYISQREHGWKNEKHRGQWRSTLKRYCADFANKKTNDVTAEDVFAAVNPIWLSKHETARRLLGRIIDVLIHAESLRWRTSESAELWRQRLHKRLPNRPKGKVVHHGAMPYDQVPAFMVKLRKEQALAARALEFGILCAARSGETLGARWDEIDLNGRLWVIPAIRMKAGREHRVPLTDAALAVLGPLHDTRRSDYVFPGNRDGRPLSNMAMEMLLRRMKISGVTPHGFRSSFRDWAGDETDFAREVAEAALAHAVGNAAEQAYRRGTALEKRRKLMEAWTEFCNSNGATLGHGSAQSA